MTSPLKIRLLRRQLRGSRHQSALFVLCVALSILTLVSLGSFGRSVQSSLLRDARTLHAADVIVHAHSPIPEPLLAAISSLEREEVIESARIYQFYSVVRKSDGEGSLLADLKVTEPGYPFYGEVELASGRPFHEVLTSGNLVVEQNLLDRLSLRVGERLHVGSTTLTVADVVTSEPDRPVTFFALGPRIFLSSDDLGALDLLGKGSRATYEVLVRVGQEEELETVVERLRSLSGERVRVETYLTAGSRVKRFFDNLLFFLDLIGIFTLLLAGIGIQSTLTALLREQERTIAIMKALGARSRFIIGHYYALILLLGLLGTSFGLAGSFLLQDFLPPLFRGFLPARVELSISAGAVGEGLLLGFATLLLFTAFPLYRLKAARPRAIFGLQESHGLRSRPAWFLGGSGALFFLFMVLLRIREVKTGLLFVLGLGGLILVATLCAEALLRLLKRWRAGSLALRQALKGLFRPGSATRPIIVTLTASLAVIFSITLIEKNLDASFVRSFPPEAPNLFFIDIQPGQKEAFAEALGMDTIYYPVVRGSVTAVGGVPIDRQKERQGRGDNLAREFNLTYRERLLKSERIVEGKGLYRPEWPEVQVSVLDTVLEMREMKIGDTIAFRIQGVPIEARISSIRSRTVSGLRPYFYFVFPEKVLADAPRTFFAAVRLEKEAIAPLQNRLAALFPNVSVIDLTETVTVFARIMERLSVIVRFFTLFSVVAGVLIVISSVFATRYARIREAVYFKILGARGRFVLAVFALESLLIGLFSGILALLLSQAGSWIVCRRIFGLDYRPFAGTSLLLLLTTTLMVIGIGLGASIPILRHKPAAFLREQADE